MYDTQDTGTNADALSLDHLRSFLAVVEHGTQGRAAQQLRVAQTTVCRHVERVQEHFGGGLFAVGNSGALSSRGQLVLGHIRAAMDELLRARERLASQARVLRIGFVRVARPLVERALRKRVEAPRRPAFDVRLLEMTTEQQVRALISGALDIAVCYARAELAGHEGVEEMVIRKQSYALVVPEGTNARGRLNGGQLSPLTFAHVPAMSAGPLQDEALAFLRGQGVVPSRRIECARGAEILAYAACGLGYGFLPAVWRAAASELVEFVPTSIAASAALAAYSLAHVAPWMAELRTDLSEAAGDVLGEHPSR